MRIQTRLANVGSIVALLSLTLYLGVQLFRPIPQSTWVPGIICATSERVSQGGPYYEAPDSFCGPLLPYPPGVLFTHHFISEITGMDAMLICRLLGVSSLLLFCILVVCAARRLGVSMAFASTSLVLAAFVLRSCTGFPSLFDTITDSMLLNSALGIVLLANSLERFSLLSLALLSVLLMAAFAFKAQGAALYLAVFLFFALRPGFSYTTQLRVAAILGVSGTAVTLLILSVPNCWTSCIAALRHQPILFSKLLTDGGPALRSFWPFLLFPLVMAITGLDRPYTLAHLLSQFRAIPSSTMMMLCILTFYLPMQVLAMVKHGGGSYDLEFVLLLALPLVSLSAYKCLRPRRGVILVLSAIGTVGFCQFSLSAWRGFPELAQTVNAQRDYLHSHYRNAKLAFICSDYYFIRNSGAAATTDLLTIWHNSAAGFEVPRAMQAIESRYYDIVIADPIEVTTWDTPLFLTFLQFFRDGYAPVIDPEMPAALRGRLFQRRPTPHLAEPIKP